MIRRLYRGWNRLACNRFLWFLGIVKELVLMLIQDNLLERRKTILVIPPLGGNNLCPELHVDLKSDVLLVFRELLYEPRSRLFNTVSYPPLEIAELIYVSFRVED